MEMIDKTNSENQRQGVKEQEIDVIALLKVLLKKWWLILLAGAFVGLGALGYAKYLIKPTYRATFTAYVNNKHERNVTDPLTNSDIQASQELVRTYTKILTSNTLLMKAADILDSDYTYADIAKMVKTGAQDDTEIINVYVTALSKEEAYKICSAIESIAPDCMADIVEGSSMKVVDTTQMPGSRNSPSYTKYSLVGAAVGALLMIAILSIRSFTNDTVNSEDELEKRYSVPVVGVIPNMSKSAVEHGGYYGYYRHRKNNAANSGLFDESEKSNDEE